MTMILYGISNCDTVKKARRWLDEQCVAYRFHDVRKDGLDAARLQSWIDALGWLAAQRDAGTIDIKCWGRAYADSIGAGSAYRK